MRVSLFFCILASLIVSSGCQMYDDSTIQHYFGAKSMTSSSLAHTSPPPAAQPPKPDVPPKHTEKDHDMPKQAGHPHHPSQGPSVVGDPCTAGAGGSSFHGGTSAICLGLKYVVYQDPSGDPIETDRDAVDNVREVNHLWGECGLQFQIDQYVPIEPTQENLRYRTAHHSELNEIRRKFSDDQTLLIVLTGSWDRSGTLGNSWANAWTNLPGEGTYGSILERPVSHHPGILAHELGHYLSLDHVSDHGDLMNPVIFPSSTALSPAQCQSARWAAGYFWKKMIRN